MERSAPLPGGHEKAAVLLFRAFPQHLGGETACLIRQIVTQRRPGQALPMRVHLQHLDLVAEPMQVQQTA